jgi:phospholipase/lecithinase/hemolysin
MKPISQLVGSAVLALAPCLPVRGGSTHRAMELAGHLRRQPVRYRQCAVAHHEHSHSRRFRPSRAPRGGFPNGPVWTEYLATGLGLPAIGAIPSNLLFAGLATGVIQAIGAPGGQNYAYGGARTGLGGSAGATTGLLGQLVAWDNSTSILGGGPLTRAADPNALYVVMAGANDLRDYRSGVSGALAPSAVAGNVVGALGLLANAGARHFMISTLPDLGLTPEAVNLGRHRPVHGRHARVQRRAD